MPVRSPWFLACMPLGTCDAGRLYVDLKFSMKAPRNWLHELLDPRRRFFNQCRAELSSMSCTDCIAVTLVPLWNLTAVRESSSHASGSSSPLYFSVVEFKLKPIGMRVPRMPRVEH